MAKQEQPIGCDKFDSENPELMRCCGDILFSNKIWLCRTCFETYKDNPIYKKVITR